MSRRFQFNLKALLVVLTAACVWLGVQANQIRRQREAIARIEHLGAIAYFADEWDDTRAWFESGAAPRTEPKWLGDLVGVDWLSPIVAIRFDSCSVSDDDLCWLIDRLPELRYVELRHTDVGDRGISSMAKLHRLQNLEIAHTRIGDGALEAIGRLRSLRSLDLCGTGVTDEGLPFLYDLSELRRIYLDSTVVTPDAVAKLERALPHVKSRRY